MTFLEGASLISVFFFYCSLIKLTLNSPYKLYIYNLFDYFLSIQILCGLDGDYRPWLKKDNSCQKLRYIHICLHCKKKRLTGNCFGRYKWNIYFKRAKFTLDFKTKKRVYICFEIKGKFRSNEIYISFKMVLIFQNSFPSKLFSTVYSLHPLWILLRN